MKYNFKIYVDYTFPLIVFTDIIIDCKYLPLPSSKLEALKV